MERLMRKPRDFDAELKALGDKARDLKSRKVQQLGELVRHGPGEGPRSFRAGRGEMLQQLIATRTALLRNRVARNRHQAARARCDMRTWQVERRKRTRHLIELGGLIVKSGIEELTGGDRAMIYGALIWIAEKLKGDHGEHARALWAAKGKPGFEND
jgi:conjugative transfer protein TraD